MTRRILPDLTQKEFEIDTDAPHRPEGDVAACDELLALLHKWHPDHAPKENDGGSDHANELR